MRAVGSTLHVSELQPEINDLADWDRIYAHVWVDGREELVSIDGARACSEGLIIELADQIPVVEKDCDREHLDAAYEPGDLPALPEALTDLMTRRRAEFRRWPVVKKQPAEHAWVVVLERPPSLVDGKAVPRPVGMIVRARLADNGIDIRFEHDGSTENGATAWRVIAT